MSGGSPHHEPLARSTATRRWHSVAGQVTRSPGKDGESGVGAAAGDDLQRGLSSTEIEVPRFLRNSIGGGCGGSGAGDERPTLNGHVGIAPLANTAARHAGFAAAAPGPSDAQLHEELLAQLTTRMEDVVQRQMQDLRRWWREEQTTATVGSGMSSSPGLRPAARRSLKQSVGLTRSRTIQDGFDHLPTASQAPQEKATRSNSAPSMGLSQAVATHSSVVRSARSWLKGSRVSSRIRSNSSVELSKVSEEGSAERGPGPPATNHGAAAMAMTVTTASAPTSPGTPTTTVLAKSSSHLTLMRQPSLPANTVFILDQSDDDGSSRTSDSD
ncbi:uncharacterized protein LOC135825618 [Sycon ciliatum]|uniref:uncharacterized protein LOC135825618 n=1 Tax=Sycon ciliatum TaxID=27933 RepID=UPI0031F6904C